MGDFIETGTLAGPMADAKPLPAGANPNLIPNLQAARWNEHRSALLDLRSHTSGWVNVRSYEDFAAALAAVGPDGAKMLINVLEPFAGYSGTAVTGAPRLIFGTNAPRFAAANGQGDDSAILITRALTGDSLFSHAVRDESTFTPPSTVRTRPSTPTPSLVGLRSTTTSAASRHAPSTSAAVAWA
jgi:hypothetical protein